VMPSYSVAFRSRWQRSSSRHVGASMPRVCGNA